jgi:folate-binding protein YgfZ
MDAKTQVDAARSGCLAVAAPEQGTLVVTGNDRVSWLNGLLTCDIAKRAPGAAAYGLAVIRSGRVMSDAVVVFDDAAARVLVAAPRATLEGLRAHFDHYLVMEDAEMAPDTDAYGVWSLHGPRSEEVLSAARSAGAVGGVVDRTGLGGAIVLVPSQAADGVRQALETAATIGDAAGWEALRLERAIPSFGVDFDEKTYPQEAGLEKVAVSFDKGCYLGQEVVCMLEMRGHVKRKLVSVVAESALKEAPARGATVTDEEGVAVGEVTSAARSPTLGKFVALAMVKRAAAQAGKHVRIDGVPAEVVDRPA